MTSFNVLYEPWIPMTNGETRSLMSALEDAGSLEGVQCESATETFAVYRLMIAFVMDAFALPLRDERMNLLKQGRFDMAVFQAYIEKCEREGASFDLFDEKHPFMQSAYSAAYDAPAKKGLGTEEEALKPVSTLVLQLPSGNNHVFLCHSPETRLTPDAALRHLLSTYLFSTAGAQDYPSSVNNAPCVYALLRGDTLFETLVLNSLAVAECGNIDYGKPAWRADPQVVPKKKFPRVDMLQALTWQPRRARLIRGADGLIAQVSLKQGHNFQGDDLWRDPHVPYQKNKDDGYTSLKPKQGRAFWRDLGTLAASQKENKRSQPPTVVQNAPEDWPIYRLILMGLVTDQGALLDLQEEELSLPREILEDPTRGDVLRGDLLFLEECAKILASNAQKIKNGMLVPILQDAFFLNARTYVFEQYLGQLAACNVDEDYMKLQNALHKTISQILRQTLERETLRMGNDSRGLQERAQLQRLVMTKYFKIAKERAYGGQ